MSRGIWRYVPFTEAVADQTACGNKLQQKFFQPDGKVPIIDQGAKAVAGYSDDIALAWKQSLPVVIFGDHTRAIKYVDYPFILGADGTKVLVPRNGLSARFLYYYLHKVNLPSQGYARHFSHLKRVEVPVPPLAEQERIVALLDEADELRKLGDKADRRTADLIPALFHEMFGDPVANSKNWPSHNIAALCDGREGIKAGPFGSSLKKECYTPSGPRVYGQEQVIAGSFSVGDYHISEEKFSEMVAYQVKSGDLLISLVGTIGKVVVVPDGVEPGIINPRLLRVRPRAEQLHACYLAYLLTATATISLLKRISTGITMGVLNAGLLKQLSIPLPPLALQQEFARRVTEIRAMEAEQATSRQRLDDLFQSMLHRAFEGRP